MSVGKRPAPANTASTANTAVDWAEIEARIDEVGRQLTMEGTDSPEHIRLVLAERARVLAMPAAVAGDEPRLEVLALDFGGQRFALETRHVIEMVRRPHAVPLPGALAPVAAVVAWRGRLLTALDLRPATEGGAFRPPLLVVLGGERAEMGLLADGVGDITTLPLDQLRDVPDGPMRWRDYLRALTTDAVAVLDGDVLLQRHAIDR